MKKIIGENTEVFSIFESAYRPFFLLATVSSLFYVSLWTAFYTFRLNLSFEPMTPSMWHGHEMLYGYTIAVIAGFLLTIEKYWLGTNTNRKYTLIPLLMLWLVARVLIALPIVIDVTYIFGAIVDCLFLVLFTIRVSYPIRSVRAWGKTGFIAHLVIVAVSNIIFYLGLFGIIKNGELLGIYSAIFMVISMILLMGRRMIPIFIRNGLEFKYEPKNWKLIDVLSIFFFVMFFITTLFFTNSGIASIISAFLAVIYFVRLYGWYSTKIWSKPMLWVLFVSYFWIVIGFGLKFLSLFFVISDLLFIHSLTYGGIGIMTIGFMTRVTLGHTGRNVFTPPKSVFWIFTILIAGATVRVFFPLIDIGNYMLWISLSQLLWIVSFVIFAVIFLPMLFKPAIKVTVNYH